MKVDKVNDDELKEVLELQYLCYRSEADLYNDYSIPPLTQSLKELEAEVSQGVCLVIRQNGVIGSVRAIFNDGKCKIGKLIVHPEFQGKGLAKLLMAGIESEFKSAEIFEVFTGHKSTKNLSLYNKLGYRQTTEIKLNGNVNIVFLEKRIRA